MQNRLNALEKGTVYGSYSNPLPTINISDGTARDSPFFPRAEDWFNQMNSISLPTRAISVVIESAYRSWLDNPVSVDPTWRAFFQGFTLGNNGGGLTASGSGTHATPEGVEISILDSLKLSL